jgi:hypothetical protein
VRRQSLAIERLVRRELVLLRNLGRDRRIASTQLTPLIRSGPLALSGQAALAQRRRPAAERA